MSTDKLTCVIASDASVKIDPAEILKGAVEVCPIGIIMVEPNGTIVFANDEMERMFGYAHNEIIGQSVDILVPANLRIRHIHNRRQFAAHPEIRMAKSRSLFGQRKDGTEFPIEIGLNPLPTRDGMVLGVIVDVNDRNRIERLKNEFVATVSHELRTPLTSIGGALGLLVGNAAGDLPSSAVRLLTIAYANSQRLIRLVNSILTLEKIVSGKVVFVLKRVEVQSLVKKEIEANHAFAETCGVRVTLDAASTIGEIRADPDWLAQVVSNLLSNAIKFSPPGDEVVVATEERDGAIHISVRDHGHGIPKDFRQRIFEKFAQADASDTRQHGGTGLGLSIVKEIVTRLGGRVDFKDVPGGGTIFDVELPRWEHETETASTFDANPTVRVSPLPSPI